MELGRRHFLQLSGLAALSAALPACGSAVLPEPDVTTAGFGENGSGTVQMWTRGGLAAPIVAAIDKFHASQDRLHIELTPIPDPQYVTKLATAIRGRRVPDLVDIDDINAMLFIYRDAFTDLTTLVAGLPYRKFLSAGHLRLATRNGRNYGVPSMADNSALWYNTELLDKAGVDPAHAVGSFDTLLEAARRVRRLGGDIYGWSIAGNSPGVHGFVVQPHIWATGTDNISGTVGSQRGHIAGNAPLRRTLEFYRSLWKEDLLPRANFADNGSTWGSDFRAGKIGFFPSSYGAVVPASDPAARKRTGVALLCGPDGGTSFFDGGDNLCIPRGAENPSGAWQFAKFLLDLPQQQQLPEGGYTPVRGDAATPEFEQKYPLNVAPLRHIDRGYAPVTLAYNLLFNQADSPFGALFRKAVFAGDIDGALRDGQRGFDNILTQAQL
jgi:multiple sugar transport system substrate-binding protein